MSRLKFEHIEAVTKEKSYKQNVYLKRTGTQRSVISNEHLSVLKERSLEESSLRRTNSPANSVDIKSD